MNDAFNYQFEKIYVSMLFLELRDVIHDET